ncbi:acylneuraminate cytidylyltransferase family protein [Sulfurimonas sp.]
MQKHASFLAVIPARGGSKRLPRKNILPLAGKPLIVWSIEAAKTSKYIDKIIVSSDDTEILKTAKEYGADIIKRPEKLASDKATTFDTLKHVIANTDKYDYIVLLQPTSPLRNSEDIDKAIEFLESKNADAVVSVCETEHSPLWANTLPADANMKNFLQKNILHKRSQELEKYYRLNGALYIAKVEKFLQEKSFFLQKNIYAYVMQQRNSIDIDTKLDFDIASYLLELSM